MGYIGQSSGYSGGISIFGGSYSWGNRGNIPELWTGHHSITTWETYSSGISRGLTNFRAGAKIFWSKNIMLKKLF